MMIDTNTIISMTEANQNFSMVTRIETGMERPLFSKIISPVMKSE